MAVKTTNMIGYHGQADVKLTRDEFLAFKHETEFTYRFENFFHPFVGELIERLNRTSLPEVLDPTYHASLETPFFDDFYSAPAQPSPYAKLTTFPLEIDVRNGGPYANYNWELLFHTPLTIAVHLSKNQRFAEAQRWFHYIFDPTSNDTSTPTPQRYWKFLAFRRQTQVTQLDELLELLSKPNPTPDEELLRESILDGYEAIRNKPFQPHAVARTRPLAYQYAVVMRYLDNLIAWGDSLFRQDTIESINEATQLYVLAANLLGERPQRIPPPGSTRPRTFAELRQAGLDELGNALVALEGQFPYNLGLPQVQGVDPDAAGPLFGIGRTLYFCIPRNDRMLAYWDTVADRLYKIRNCMNIEGVVRQLALFDPPLDPGLLVKAAAAGLNIGALISGLNQPASPVRATLLIQKALELCGEVRALGNALLTAIEKADGERLALLRQGHELEVQQLAQEVRFLQWKQAQESTEALLRGRASALERYSFYQRLLTLTPDDGTTPAAFALDRSELTEETFDEVYAALVGQYELAVATAAYPPLSTRAQGRLALIEGEYAELNEHAEDAYAARVSAGATELTTAALAAIPQLNFKASYWGIGPETELTGGAFFANVGRAISAGYNLWALSEEHAGRFAARTAGYERRADDWLLQHNLAANELMQIGRQLIGALIAEQVAYREYANVQRQIENTREVDEFLRSKFTNEELYGWLQGELARLYYEYYRFAFDTARKAEQAAKRELLRPELDATEHVRFNYWDGGRRGLLSGEGLYLDVKRLELAYYEHNKREYELTKHVSLRRLDPIALLELKATGTCEVALPEWLFDLDGPGHYLRRIKSVGVSIPAVAGPYTSVSCTLTLLRSTLRRSPALRDGEYPRAADGEDDRFIDYYGAVQSIVTSNAQNDAGLFETNLRDERYLPFEGAGAESVWRLELPAEFRQFDYTTIADVILHLRFTARQGGAQLRERAVTRVRELIEAAETSGLAQLFSLRHDFPTEWQHFVSGAADFSAAVTKEHFPYFVQGSRLTFSTLTLYAIQGDALASVTPAAPDLPALATALNDTGAFDLQLPEDPAVLTRDQQALVFAVLEYAIE